MVIFRLELEKLLFSLTSAPSVCQNVVFLAKKLFQMKDQYYLIWVFLGWNLKKLLCCGILHQHPQIFLNTKFHPKKNICKFGTKTSLIVFSARISKTSVVFEISVFEFVNMQRFIQKQENFKLGTKNTLFGYF